MPFALLPILLLSAAGFTVLTTEFLIVGLLPAMALDLRVTIPQAGLLVTLFAFTVAAAGPPLTAWLSGVERKRLFVGVLVVIGFANALAAVAPNIGVMAVARFIPALILPVFWALASDTAVQLTGPARAGKAISMIAFGIVAATVLGIPIGTLISDAFGWRNAFAALSLVAFAKAMLLLFFLPRIAQPDHKSSMASQIRILRDPVVVGHVLLSVLVFTGMFTAYTYLADILGRLAGISSAHVGWWLMGFGAVGLLGNSLGGRVVDRSPLGATLFFSVVVALAMAAILPALASQWGLAAALGAWGIAQAALLIICHVRVMKAAPEAQAFAASLNISGANVGIGLGALVGGRVIDGYGLAPVGGVAAGVMVLATLAGLLLLAAMAVARSRSAAAVACIRS
ncbi:Predicted arabinose efflux permease, MFS family [Polaromonas sp. YR568]|uniref:MFS transporter n=1 Tax=Polaromonas sp. YR568 TaxID=1855301 RepID=UPI0008F2B8F9|nr:MFS transporter [Polaromonas sp. YR568]SFV03597.1 Predicted arabinose efflux permease, MFS family [Polaromonas sp. YR568]